jgi:tetratricopeptide (TPR) repeat protein
MKCVHCHARKGKRSCQINGGQHICPQCCAATRRDDCAGCGYFAATQAYQRDKSLQNKRCNTNIMPDVDRQCSQALALAERGKVTKAQDVLAKLEQEHPGYHTILYGLGVCHALQDRIDEAIPFLKRAVEVHPLFAEAYYNLASAYLKQADLPNAVQACRDAIKVDGERGEIGSQARDRLNFLETIIGQHQGMNLSTYVRSQEVFQKGYQALRDNRFQDAVSLFNQVLAIDSHHVQSHGNIGMAHAGLGNKTKALEHLDRAVELDPEYEPALLNRIAVEQMTEGEPLPVDHSKENVHYYRDYTLKGRSRIREVLQSLQPSSSAPR